ncbi:glycosyltransferase family 2 protein [Thalassotalea montiporae]
MEQAMVGKTDKLAPLVGVVIPFFQRKEGLITKCVTSILQQRGYDNYHVLVVDDESPISAESELKSLLNETNKVTILKQRNSGPGAARNRGLDNLPSDTKYVAFLDSDDWWEPDFLVRAVEALEKGNDLFFSDSQRYGFDESRFQWQASKNLNLIAKQHQCINEASSLYKFKGDFFNYALVRSNIISTSAMVYRLSLAPSLRFNTEIYNGQDRLFKLSISQRTNAVAFASKVLVQEGEGINIFDSAKWGTHKSLVLNSSYIKLCCTIMDSLKLEPEHFEIVKSQLAECRQAMVSSTLHLLKTRQKVDWGLYRKAFSSDPKFALAIIPITLKLAFGRV